MSACIAVRLSIVSSSDSPLAVLERVMSRLKTSADRRRAAISNVVRVRVLFSKKRLKTLLPRSSGTFLTSRSAMLMKLSAVVRIALDDGPRQSFDGKQMMQFAVAIQLRVRPHHSPPRFSIVRCSRSSSSRVSTTLMSAGTSIVAPTTVAATGSSRPPRSTSTARSMRAGRP